MPILFSFRGCVTQGSHDSEQQVIVLVLKSLTGVIKKWGQRRNMFSYNIKSL